MHDRVMIISLSVMCVFFKKKHSTSGNAGVWPMQHHHSHSHTKIMNLIQSSIIIVISGNSRPASQEQRQSIILILQTTNIHIPIHLVNGNYKYFKYLGKLVEKWKQPLQGPFKKKYDVTCGGLSALNLRLLLATMLGTCSARTKASQAVTSFSLCIKP